MRTMKKINIALFTLGMLGWTGLMATHADEWKAPKAQPLGTPVATMGCEFVPCSPLTSIITQMHENGCGIHPGPCSPPTN